MDLLEALGATTSRPPLARTDAVGSNPKSEGKKTDDERADDGFGDAMRAAQSETQDRPQTDDRLRREDENGLAHNQLGRDSETRLETSGPVEGEETGAPTRPDIWFRDIAITAQPAVASDPLNGNAKASLGGLAALLPKGAENAEAVIVAAGAPAAAAADAKTAAQSPTLAEIASATDKASRAEQLRRVLAEEDLARRMVGQRRTAQLAGDVRQQPVKTVDANMIIPPLSQTLEIPPGATDLPEAIMTMLENSVTDGSDPETLKQNAFDSAAALRSALGTPQGAQMKEKLDALLSSNAALPLASGERPALSPDHVAQQLQAAQKLDLQHHIAQAGAADAARQVIAAIRSEAGGHRIEVRLDPPELGHVRIQFAMDRADSVVAVVSSDRNDTLDTMRRHAADLARELSRAGFANVELEFKSGGGQSHQGAAASFDSSSGAAPAEEPAEPLTYIYARASVDGRLDRLV